MILKLILREFQNINLSVLQKEILRLLQLSDMLVDTRLKEMRFLVTWWLLFVILFLLVVTDINCFDIVCEHVA